MIIRRLSTAFVHSARFTNATVSRHSGRNLRCSYATASASGAETTPSLQESDSTEATKPTEKKSNDGNAKVAESAAGEAPVEAREDSIEQQQVTPSDNTSAPETIADTTEKAQSSGAKAEAPIREKTSTIEGQRASILRDGISAATPIEAEGVARVIMQRMQRVTTRLNPTVENQQPMGLEPEAKDMIINRLAKGEHDEQGILQGKEVYGQKTLNDIARSTLLNPTYGSSDAERFRLKVQSLLPAARKAAPTAKKS